MENKSGVALTMEWIAKIFEVAPMIKTYIALVALVILVFCVVIWRILDNRNPKYTKMIINYTFIITFVSIILLFIPEILKSVNLLSNQPVKDIECRAGIEGVLNDNPSVGADNNYMLDVSLYGKSIFFDSARKGFINGDPGGKSFNTWRKLDIPTKIKVKEGGVVPFSVYLNESQYGIWIGIKYIYFKCDNKKSYSMRIEDYTNKYGPGGSSVGILNVGVLRNWNFEISKKNEAPDF